MPSRSLLVLIAAFAISCSEQFQHSYATGAAALSSAERERGWIPKWLPGNAADVQLQYDLDTYDRWLRFRLSSSEREPFLRGLRPIPESGVRQLRIRSPRGAEWWFEGLIQQHPANDAALNSNLFSGDGATIPHSVVVAIDRVSDDIYLWIPPAAETQVR